MSKANELAMKAYPTDGCFKTEPEPISEYQFQVEMQAAFRRGYEECALSQEPKQTVNQDFIQSLKDLRDCVGAPNFSSHTQMKEALVGAQELIEDIISRAEAQGGAK